MLPSLKRFRIASVLLLFLLGIAMAQPDTDPLRDALRDLCIGVKGLVPVAAMLMVTLAAVIYAVGQMMGAETRARANVWATSCLTGALIGIIIVAITPPLLATLLGETIDC